AQLENPSSWWRETAQRLLYERQDKSAVNPLRKLAAQSRLPLARLHALWCLDGLQQLRENDIAGALVDPSPGVREHAVRLAEKALHRHTELIARVLPLASDPAPRVRFQVAFTLGEAGIPDATISGLARIAENDASDTWIRTAVLSSSVN